MGQVIPKLLPNAIDKAFGNNYPFRKVIAGEGNPATDNLIAKYLLQINGNDSLSSDVLTNTHSTTKFFFDSSLAVQSVTANVAAYTGAALLAEGASTNLLTFAQDKSESDWVKTRCAISTDSETDPMGDTANILIPDTSVTTSHFANNPPTVVSGTVYTAWSFIKIKDARYPEIRLQSSTGGSTHKCWFDILNGTVGTEEFCSGFITAYPDDWYLCEMVLTADVSAAGNFLIVVAETGENSQFTGDGIAGQYVGLSDYEAGTRASSPIKTTTVPVTRTTDTNTIPVQMPTNNATFYLEFTPRALDGVSDVILDTRSDGNNGFHLLATSSVVRLTKIIASVQHTAEASITLVVGTTYQIKCEYNSTTGMEINVNGTLGTDSETGNATSGSSIHLNSTITPSDYSYGLYANFKAATGTGYTLQEMADA